MKIVDADFVGEVMTDMHRALGAKAAEIAEIAKLRIVLAGLLEQWDRGPLAVIDYDKIDAARAALEQRVSTDDQTNKNGT